MSAVGSATRRSDAERAVAKQHRGGTGSPGGGAPLRSISNEEKRMRLERRDGDRRERDTRVGRLRPGLLALVLLGAAGAQPALAAGGIAPCASAAVQEVCGKEITVNT